jgi:hypothetical protein
MDEGRPVSGSRPAGMNRAALILLALALAGLNWLHAARAQTVWPAGAPSSWGLAIIDIETTGLDPAYHEMIDLGVIYADLDGYELGRTFIRIMPEHPGRLHPAAQAVNGFTEERWRELGSVSPAEAAAAFLDFHAAQSSAHPGPDGEARIWLFTAYNAWFDRAFLDQLLLANGASVRDLYSYFLLDLPSMAWGAGIRELKNSDVAASLGLPPETTDPLEHTGLTGAQWNLAIYRALRARE